MRPCGMTVLGVDARRTEAPPSVKELRRPPDLHTLLPQADFVVMTVPAHARDAWHDGCQENSN